VTQRELANSKCYIREDGGWLSVAGGWLGAWAGAGAGAAGCNSSSGMPFTTNYRQSVEHLI